MDEAEAERKPTTGVKLQGGTLINAAFIFVLVFAWLIQTNVGLADNGDYARTMTWVTSGPIGFAVDNPPRADPEWERRYFFNWIPEWKLDYPGTPRFLSSAWLLWWPGVWFNQLFISDKILYLQTFSIVPKLILGALFVCLLLWIDRQKNRWLYVTTALPILLILIDTNYIAPLNSFYFESAQFVFLFLFLAALLYHWHKRSWVSLAYGMVALLLLASSKASSIYWPLLGVPFLLKDRVGLAPKVYLPISFVLSLGLSLIAFGVTQPPATALANNQFNSLFAGVLTFSDSPAQRLDELGIAEATECMGHSTFDAIGTTCLARLGPQMTFANTLRVIIREPLVAGRMMGYAAEQMRPRFGNQPIYIENGTFRPRIAIWPVVKYLGTLNGWLFVPVMLATLLLCLHSHYRNNDKHNYIILLGILLVAVLPVEMFVQVAGDGRQEVMRHLYLSYFVFDLALIVLLSLFVQLDIFQIWQATVPRWVILVVAIVSFAITSLFVSLDNTRRADFAEILIGTYSQITNQAPKTSTITITDIQLLPISEQIAIRQLYGLQITRGTINDSINSQFNPDESTHPPEASAFIRRWFAAVWAALRP